MRDPSPQQGSAVSGLKLVWLLPEDYAPGSADAAGGTRFERVALDTDGLGDTFAGFGFDEVHGGIATAPLDGPVPDPPLGELQRATREIVAFQRAEPIIEIAAFVHRVPGLTREEFQVRYRALGLRMRVMEGPAQLMCRYAQNHVIGEEEGPDGVSELGFASIDDLQRFIADPWLPEVLLPYEAEFLAHPRTIQMLTRRREIAAPVPAPASMR
jgi:hypothetical protein